MNALFLQFGLERFKPFVTALMLPPVPFLLLAMLGMALFRRRRPAGATLITASVVLIWLSGCVGVAERTTPWLLNIPPAFDATQMDALGKQADGRVAIIVLGGGVEEWAPEYGASSLYFRSLERLRYGVWLGRRTGWPVGFSGGLGWGQPVSGRAREATVAQRIATEEYGRPLRWLEDKSRDTRENARLTLEMLAPQGVRHIVLVTHAVHMPRALRNFERAKAPGVLIHAAPIGLSGEDILPILRWIPTGEGLVQSRMVVREWLGMVGGA